MRGSSRFTHKARWVDAQKALKIKVGDPLEAATETGPVANRAQFDRICGLLDKAKGEGVTVLAGGGGVTGPGLEQGLFIAPTVFAGVQNTMQIAREEVFGPVLSIICFDDEEHAVAMANDSEYGLASGIWTSNIARAHMMARRMESGQVWVNTYRTSGAQVPFGGIKRSGYGRVRGYQSMLEYTYVKNVMVNLD